MYNFKNFETSFMIHLNMQRTTMDRSKIKRNLNTYSKQCLISPVKLSTNFYQKIVIVVPTN